MSAAAYNPVAAGVRRIVFEDISADIVGHVLAIRGTSSFATLCRDMEVEPVVHHDLGACQAGALRAALGLLPLIPAEVDTVTGHSEGGCIAVIVAALHGARRLVTWDAPKAGGDALAAALAGCEARQYRFYGSPVSGWPWLLDRHIVTLTGIGDWSPDPITAHSIDRAVAWLTKLMQKVIADPLTP